MNPSDRDKLVRAAALAVCVIVLMKLKVRNSFAMGFFGSGETTPVPYEVDSWRTSKPSLAPPEPKPAQSEPTKKTAVKVGSLPEWKVAPWLWHLFLAVVCAAFVHLALYFANR